MTIEPRAPDRRGGRAAVVEADRRAWWCRRDGTDGPLGILSERDIVRELGRRGAAVLGDQVAALMTEKLVTCTAADEAVDQVLARMTEGRFRHMPVMAGEPR